MNKDEKQSNIFHMENHQVRHILSVITQMMNVQLLYHRGYIAVVPTQKGNKNELGMSGRVYFNVFNKIFFLTEYRIRTCDR